MRDTIEMAREAGAMFDHMMWIERDLLPVFQRFEALVRADERAQPAPVQEPVAHPVIAGALFDFMGYLTSQKERIVLSAADDASPAADAIKDFATKRGLSLNEAQVREWMDALAPQPVPVKTYHDGKPWPVQPVPHECQTEAEKTAYAFGWWKAMEYVREHGVIK
jgi:hypothetical protein